MPILNILSDSDASGGMPFLPYDPTETEEIFSGAFEWGMLGRNMAPRVIAEESHQAERDSILKERFGPGLFDSIRQQAIDSLEQPAPTWDAEAGALAYNADISRRTGELLDATIAEGRRSGDPNWNGLRTNEEIRDDLRNLARQSKEASDEATAKARTPLGAAVGTLGGGLAAGMLDPINLATIPFGAGASMGVLRAIGTEIGFNAAVEAVQSPFVAAWQNQLGYKYGLGDAATDIAFAGAGAGVLTGVTRGIGAGFRGIGGLSREAGERSTRILDSIASSPRVPSQARDAAKYMSRTAHIDESLPPTADVSTGRAAMQETQDAFREYREPLYPERAWSPDDVAAMRDAASQMETEMLRDVETRLQGKQPIDARYTEAVAQRKALTEELKTVKKPQSVVAFLRANGGLKESAGELRAMGVTAKKMPGLLNNKSGRTFDEAGELLAQAGYFTERPDVNQVINAIADEVNNGKRTISQAETDAELRRGEIDAQLQDIERFLAEGDAPARKEIEARNRGIDLSVASYRRKAEERIALLRAEADKAEQALRPKAPEPANITDDTARLKSLAPSEDTSSPEFRQWFAGSKAVDENGNPKVFYHGTAYGTFDAFDPYSSNYGLMGHGSYFTENPEIALSYTDKGAIKLAAAGKDVDRTVYPVYLSAKNPLDMDGKAEVKAWATAFEEFIDEQTIRKELGDNPTNEAVYRLIEDEIQDRQIPSDEISQVIQDNLKEMGHDSVTHLGGGRVDKEGPRHTVMIVFDPEQVRFKAADALKVDAGKKVGSSVDPESPEFKDWFSGSQVADDDGKPIETYVESVSKNAGKRDSFQVAKPKDERFSGKSFFLNIKNPFLKNTDKNWNFDRTAIPEPGIAKIREILGDRNVDDFLSGRESSELTYGDLSKLILSAKTDLKPTEVWDRIIRDALGFDGIENGIGKDKSWRVFDDSQILSKNLGAEKLGASKTQEPFAATPSATDPNFPPFENRPIAGLMGRPNDAFAAMQAELDAGAHLEADDAFDVSWEQFLRDNLEDVIDVDGVEYRMSDIADEIKADENVIAAVRTCGIG